MTKLNEKPKMVKVSTVNNYNTFLDLERFPIGGMLVINGREEFDMVNITSMSYISKVKLAFNCKEDVIKLFFEDNSTELVIMDNCTEITINGYTITSLQTFSEFTKLVKAGIFSNINKKY